MSLQIGDWVRVISRRYYFTVEDSIGVVISLSYDSAYIDFKEFGPTVTEIPHGREFNIRTEHLEKIAMPMHLVSGPIVIPPQAIAPQKTREEKIEIFSRKIDSEEVLLDCMSECGYPRDLLGGNWCQARDNSRVNLGYFKHVTLPEDCTTKLQDVYLHISKCGTKVAFYENEDKQKRDICTVMGYGRYLTKYHPELDNEQVKAAVDTFNYDHGAAPEVHFGESQDEFIRAINEGPSESCMQGLDFAGHIHPAAAYAAGDIKVAWLERDDRITARTLINKQTRAFSRVYGDHAKLKPLLEDMGYESQVGALAGCRLLMIDNEDGEGYIMPYVDAGVGTGGGALKFYADGSCFMLSESKGTSTAVGNDYDGVTEPQGSEYTCDNCGDECDEDDLNYTYHETSVCQHCLDNSYENALVSRGEHQWVRNNRCVWVECREEWVHENYLSDLDVVCDDFSGEYIELDDAVETVKGKWTHRDSCIKCGTDSNGEQLWIHLDEKRDSKPDELLKDGYGDYFWYESSEVRAWVESEGEEGFDPEAFVPVRKAVVEVPKVEEVKAPDLKTEAKGPLKVGDMVEVIKSYGCGPDGHVGRVLSVGETSVVVETPNGSIHIGAGRGWWHQFNSVRLIQAIKEETPTPNTWRAAYLRMQERGVRFTDEGAHNDRWSFTDPQHMYKIDPAQTPPSDWQEIYKEAQASGVDFDFKMTFGGEWLPGNVWTFTGAEFNRYRLKGTA